MPMPYTPSRNLDLSRANWLASPEAPTTSGRVEIADLGGHTAMRESASVDGSVLVFTVFEWECFVDGVTKGEFGTPPSPH